MVIDIVAVVVKHFDAFAVVVVVAQRESWLGAFGGAFLDATHQIGVVVFELAPNVVDVLDARRFQEPWIAFPDGHHMSLHQKDRVCWIGNDDLVVGTAGQHLDAPANALQCLTRDHGLGNGLQNRPVVHVHVFQRNFVKLYNGGVKWLATKFTTWRAA